MHTLGAHPCTAITALTAQNSCQVKHIQHTTEENLQHTLNALLEDMPPKAVKIGMLPVVALIRQVEALLTQLDAPVVLDPVMITTSGTRLIDDEAIGALQQLMTRCQLITPNLFEAEELVGRKLVSHADVERAAEELTRNGCQSVLIKGGHCTSSDGEPNVAQDYFYQDKIGGAWLTSPRVSTDNNHGTGCTLSSAAATFLAHGYCTLDACVLAKAYVNQGLRHAVKIGQGPGPVHHTTFPCDPAAMPMLSRSAEKGLEKLHFESCEPIHLIPIVASAENVCQVAEAGAEDVQLRLKGLAAVHRLSEIEAAQAACKKRGVRLWVNDFWEDAIKVGCYGVHLGATSRRSLYV